MNFLESMSLLESWTINVYRSPYLPWKNSSTWLFCLSTFERTIHVDRFIIPPLIKQFNGLFNHIILERRTIQRIVLSYHPWKKNNSINSSIVPPLRERSNWPFYHTILNPLDCSKCSTLLAFSNDSVDFTFRNWLWILCYYCTKTYSLINMKW